MEAFRAAGFRPYRMPRDAIGDPPLEPVLEAAAQIAAGKGRMLKMISPAAL